MPSASINSTEGQFYAGSRQTLTCMVLLDELVDTQVNVSILWHKSGVLISNNSRISVSDVSQISNRVYQVRVTFSPVSMTLDSGQYSCETSVSAYPASPHIADSPLVTTLYSLTVEGIQYTLNLYKFSTKADFYSLFIKCSLANCILNQQDATLFQV